MLSSTLHVPCVSALMFAVLFWGCPGNNQNPQGQPGLYAQSWTVVDQAGNIIPLTKVDNAAINGHVTQRLPGNVGTDATFAGITDGIHDLYFPNAIVPAVWQSTIINNCPNPVSKDTFTVTFENPRIDWYCEPVYVATTFPTFSLSGDDPTISVQGSGFDASAGMPKMNVYIGGSYVGTVSASSVAGDGSSATFPFPTYQGGYQLGGGFYGYSVGNVDGSGNFNQLGVGEFGVGSGNTSMTTPYGVTAFDDTTWSSNCMSDSWYGTYCSGGQGTKQDYAVTLASPGQVCFEGACVNVGSEPTDLKTWGSGSGQTYHEDDGCNDVGSGEIQCYWVDSGWTGPRYAITTDYASNTSTIVDLLYMTVVATVPVGTNPMAVALDSNQQNAYVANYGSATVSQINLSGYYVANTIYVGANPAALALDPSGNSLWVGASNNMANVNLSNFSITNDWLEGQATSVAISAAQNSWICTTISNDQSTFVAEDASLSDSWNYHDDVSMPVAGTYYSGGGTGSTPPPYLKAGAGVSVELNNGIAVTSTPTGFAIIDMVNHSIIMQGTTPTPVRGIATNPEQNIAYLTEPESNSIITVTLPQ